MKKLMASILILLLITASGALAETTTSAPIVLDATTIIDGNLIYYSGSVDGGESGVFVISADGSEVRKLMSANMDTSYTLLALSGGNLFAVIDDYSEGNSYSANIVIHPDGTTTEVQTGDYAFNAIAAGGRFYWGTGSCNEDGSDVEMYFQQAEARNYYPLAVMDNYFYYLDWSQMSDQVFMEGFEQPMGASLNRMNLSSRTIEQISDLGTNFIGIDSGKIYYTRTNFWTFSEDFDSTEMTVDEGLFSADLGTLQETRLTGYSAGDEENNVVESWQLLKDGIIYGTRSIFSMDADGEYSLMRITTDGQTLPSIPLNSDAWALSWVDGNTLYVSQCEFEITEDDFIQRDSIIAIDANTGTQTVIMQDTEDQLFYSESDPSVALVNGRIYFIAYDVERWSVCLKSVDLTGGDPRLLARGISNAEG